MKTAQFTTAIGLYAIIGSKNEMTDQISARLTQLCAMLSVTYGELGEKFRADQSDGYQDAFMWTCNQIAEEVRELFGVLCDPTGVSGPVEGKVDDHEG